MSVSSKAPPPEFDQYAGTYDGAVNRSLPARLKVDVFTRMKAEYINEILAREFDAPARLAALDIGCGVGNIHQFIEPKVGRLTGVDVSAASVEVARQRNPSVTYLSYEGEQLPFGDATFDVAFTICVVHHVPPNQWPSFFAEMKRVLRPGGIALIFEHNPWNPFTRRIVSNCEFDQDAVLLKAGKTQELMMAAGFREVSSRFISLLPSNAPIARTLERMVGFLPIGAQYYTEAWA